MTSEPTAEAVCACGEKQSDGVHAPDPGREPWVKGRHPFKPREEPEADAVAAALRVRLDTLATRWYDDQSAYPDTDVGKHAAAAVRCCIDELGEVMDAAQAEAPRVAELEAALRDIRREAGDVDVYAHERVARSQDITARALAPSAEKEGGEA